MRRRFRLPEDDQEDELEEPPPPPKLPLPEKARGMALLGLAAIVACQGLFPLPLPYVLVFSLVGAVAGTISALVDQKVGTFGGMVFCMALDFFAGPNADARLIARTSAIAVGAFFLAEGVGLLIQHAWEAKHGG